jgi:hypothetical protein
VKQVNFRVDLVNVLQCVWKKKLFVDLTRIIVGSTRTGMVLLTMQRVDAFKLIFIHTQSCRVHECSNHTHELKSHSRECRYHICEC